VETPLKNLGVASVTRFSYATEVIDSHCFSVSKEEKKDFLSGLSFFQFSSLCTDNTRECSSSTV
jgi:hypothetical protein